MANPRKPKQISLLLPPKKDAEVIYEIDKKTDRPIISFRPGISTSWINVIAMKVLIRALRNQTCPLSYTLTNEGMLKPRHTFLDEKRSNPDAIPFEYNKKPPYVLVIPATSDPNPEPIIAETSHLYAAINDAHFKSMQALVSKLNDKDALLSAIQDYFVKNADEFKVHFAGTITRTKKEESKEDLYVMTDQSGGFHVSVKKDSEEAKKLHDAMKKALTDTGHPLLQNAGIEFFSKGVREPVSPPASAPVSPREQKEIATRIATRRTQSADDSTLGTMRKSKSTPIFGSPLPSPRQNVKNQSPFFTFQKSPTIPCDKKNKKNRGQHLSPLIIVTPPRKPK